MLSKKVYEKRFNRLLTVVIKKTRSFCSMFLSNKGTYCVFVFLWFTLWLGSFALVVAHWYSH
jgi:hypothetical protein